MQRLPVIVSFGGISPAGRSSFHYGYQRLIFDKLSTQEQHHTLQHLAVLMGLVHYDQGQWHSADGNAIALNTYLDAQRQRILDGTLIRKLEDNLFDPANLPMHSALALERPEQGPDAAPLRFRLAQRRMPATLPQGWTVIGNDGDTLLIEARDRLDVLVNTTFPCPVNTAGQLPSGFEPQSLYSSRHHPRGLQMTLYAASDALNAMGIDWDLIQQKVAPDQVAVYAGSSLNQLDYDGYGGLLKARLLGKKITSKQLPLGFGEMPADFVNAYMLGNVGNTGTNLGACASFHYNLNQAVKDIQRGTHRIVVVGSSEAPLTPDIIEAFANMNALADDASLMALDGSAAPDHRRACRPFGNNVGFTLSEAAQFVVLFDDALALEFGASIHGAVNDVFINADGFKKSIASPGVGNYLTVAKAAAATQAVIGEKGLRQRSFMQAHGTGTPQNRVTESAIFSEIARHFGIEHWPVAALKSYLGHSIACSGADQLVMTLGVWRHGVIPGILTTDSLADDVSRQGLDILLQHRECDPQAMDAALLNSKGFGGNNATASILAPHLTRRMLEKRHGKAALQTWQQRNEAVEQTAQQYHQKVSREPARPLYRYDHDVRDGNDLRFDTDGVTLRGYGMPVSLKLPNLYGDMCD